MSAPEPERYDAILARVCDAMSGVCVVGFFLSALSLDTGFSIAFLIAAGVLQLLRP